jgi:Bacterial SH3 domain
VSFYLEPCSVKKASESCKNFLGASVAYQLQGRSGHVFLIKLPGTNFYKIVSAKQGRLQERLGEIAREHSQQVILVCAVDVVDQFAVRNQIYELLNGFHTASKWWLEIPSRFPDDAISKAFEAKVNEINNSLCSTALHGYIEHSEDTSDEDVYSDDDDSYEPQYRSAYYDDSSTGVGWIIVVVVGFVVIAFFAGISGISRQQRPHLRDASRLEQRQGLTGVIQAPGYSGANLWVTPKEQLIVVVPNGSIVTLLELSNDQQWQRIRTSSGLEGWVWAEFVK